MYIEPTLFLYVRLYYIYRSLPNTCRQLLVIGVAFGRAATSVKTI
jgi:hypothetical protein